MNYENTNDLITLEELCEMLMIGKSTAYKLLQSKSINAFRIGRVWRIPKSSVYNFISQSTTSIIPRH